MTPRGPGIALLLCAVAAAIWPRAVAAAAADNLVRLRVASGSAVDNDAVWEGTVLVEGPVSVKAGVRLTVRPGARLLFADGAELNVAGALVARGTPGAPVRFQSAATNPGKGSWKGITLGGTGEGSALVACVVGNAEAVRIAGGAHEISGCAIRDGTIGISVGSGAFARISGCTISGMTEAGVDCQRNSAPVVDNNVIRDCGAFGIGTQRNAAPKVTNNAISGCDVGVSYASPAPAPEGNRLANNRVGIGVNDVGAGMSVTRNLFLGNGTGLWIQHFSSPRVEGNLFDNNGVGIHCYRSSSPELRRNTIVRSRQGIVCQHMCEPRIVANVLAGNATAVYLTLSSYAVMNGNNFDNNAIQVELGVMSHDWEVRAGRKPLRGEPARRTGQRQRWGEQARGLPRSGDAVIGSGVVDATGNWWGGRDTAEMNAKGGDADIRSLIDGRDVAPQKSEGYEGEFARDRIDYGGWKAERIPGAGAAGFQLPERSRDSAVPRPPPRAAGRAKGASSAPHRVVYQ